MTLAKQNIRGSRRAPVAAPVHHLYFDRKEFLCDPNSSSPPALPS